MFNIDEKIATAYAFPYNRATTNLNGVLDFLGALRGNALDQRSEKDGLGWLLLKLVFGAISSSQYILKTECISVWTAAAMAQLLNK